MKTLWFCLLFLAAFSLLLQSAPYAASQQVTGHPEGQILTAGSRRMMILDPTGAIVWQHKTGLTHDTWMLPNGHILYADGSAVTELTRGQKVVFQYRPENQRGGGAFSCQRLDNGNTLVGENSTGRVLEVNPAGRIVFTLQTSPCEPGAHHNMRMTRKLKNGNYLVCHSGAHLVKEYTPVGKVVLELKLPNIAFSAIRTPQNTTLVACLDKIVEFDAGGKSIWEFAKTDLPGVTIRNICGLHLLANGNIAAGCYSAYDKKDGSGTGLFEITRDKKLVWRYANPAGPDGTMMPIVILDANGKPLAGETLR